MNFLLLSLSERALLLPGSEQPVQPERHEVSDHLLHCTRTPADGRFRYADTHTYAGVASGSPMFDFL